MPAAFHQIGTGAVAMTATVLAKVSAMSVSEATFSASTFDPAKGHSRREAAVHFEVAPSCAIKLVAAHDRTGSCAPKPEGGWRYSKLDPHRAFLERRIAERPDITMPELATEMVGLL